MKKILFIILLVNFTYSQNIRATYTVTVSENKTYASSFEKELLQKTNNSVNSTNPYLLFNKNNCVFKIDDNAIVENDLVKVIILSVKKPFYTNFEKKLNYYASENKKYIITDSILLNWELSSESKMINNLKCYKATQVHRYSNGKTNGNLKYFTKNVTAWYAPEINYNYGPRGFAGLPGLIIELQYDTILYGLNKIEFDVDEKIDTVTTEKSISQKEYETVFMKEMQENLKNREIEKQ